MKECNLCNELIDYHEIIECITSALDAKDLYTTGSKSCRTCIKALEGNGTPS